MSVIVWELGGYVDIFVFLVEIGEEVKKLRGERENFKVICVMSFV